jgi:hypothetical protein
MLDALLYLAWLRCVPSFYGEKRIFRYHLISGIIYSALALAGFALAPSWSGLAVAAGLIAGRGIYSVTFLELWSLAQGSYSLSILGGVEPIRGTDPDDLKVRFARLGDAKRAGRLAALLQMRLAVKQGDRIELTWRGRTAAAGCALLRWLPNLTQTG